MRKIVLFLLLLTLFLYSGASTGTAAPVEATEYIESTENVELNSFQTKYFYVLHRADNPYRGFPNTIFYSAGRYAGYLTFTGDYYYEKDGYFYGYYDGYLTYGLFEQFKVED